METRTYSIGLPATLSPDERLALRSCLSGNPDVVDFTLEDSRLRINYQFPRTSRAVLWQQLKGLVGAYRKRSLANLAHGLLAYMEANEQQHLSRHTGWQRYVQDIYIRHVHPGDGAPGRRKNWEQYRRPGTPQDGSAT